MVLEVRRLGKFSFLFAFLFFFLSFLKAIVRKEEQAGLLRDWSLFLGLRVCEYIGLLIL